MYDLLTQVAETAPRKTGLRKSDGVEEDRLAAGHSIDGENLAPDRCAPLATALRTDALQDTQERAGVIGSAGDAFTVVLAGNLSDGVFEDLTANVEKCQKFTTKWPTASTFNNERTFDVDRYKVSLIRPATDNRIDLNISRSGQIQVVDDDYDCLDDRYVDGPGTCMYDYTSQQRATFLRNGGTWVKVAWGSRLERVGSAKQQVSEADFLAWGDSIEVDLAQAAAASSVASTG